MIAQMSKKVSSFFISNSIIKTEDKEIYDYSIEILLATLLNFIALVIIAIFTQKTLETLAFLIGFMPLRAMAGGYHAKTHLRCFLMLITTFSCFLFVTNYINNEFILIIQLANIFITFIIIFFLAPVADSNKPLSEKERSSLKFKSVFVTLILSFFVILLYFLFPDSKFALSISFGMCSVTLSVLLAQLKKLAD